MKKTICLLLCLVMVLALSVNAFADQSAEEIHPLDISEATHYINASNVNLRSGAGLSYSSGGLVQLYDLLHLTPNSDGSYYKYNDDLLWVHVHMDSGSNSGNSGYVANKYVSAITIL